MLRIYLRDQAPAMSIAKTLKPRGDSTVSLVVIKPEGEGEVEIELPGQYQVTPPVAGAVKAIPGVVDVELV